MRRRCTRSRQKVYTLLEKQEQYLSDRLNHPVQNQHLQMPDEVCNETEKGFVGVETHGLVVVLGRMIPLEGIALFVFEEDAGDATDSKRIVVAFLFERGQLQTSEITSLAVELLENGKSPCSSVAGFAVEFRIVVANHVDIKKILDAGEGLQRMFHVPS